MMNRESQKRDQELDKTPSRKPYATPTLAKFGPVGVLTQAGTAGSPEMNGVGQGMVMI